MQNLPEQEGHDTIDPEEPLDAWWTYADRREGDIQRLLSAPTIWSRQLPDGKVLTTSPLALAGATGKQAYSILAGLQAT